MSSGIDTLNFKFVGISLTVYCIEGNFGGGKFGESQAKLHLAK